MNCITKILESSILMGVLKITYFYFLNLVFIVMFSVFIYGAYFVFGLEFIPNIFYPLSIFFCCLVTALYLVGIPIYLFFKFFLE